MKQDELNVLSQFETLSASFKHLLIASELLTYAQSLYFEIIEIRKKLSEVERAFPVCS